MGKLYKPAEPSHITRILIGVFSNSLFLVQKVGDYECQNNSARVEWFVADSQPP